VQDPDGQGGGGVVAEDDMPRDNGFDVGEQFSNVDPGRVGRDGVEDDGFLVP
jgi:hypothetical protein